MDLLRAAVYVLRRSGVPMSVRDVAQVVVKEALVDLDPLLSLDDITEAVHHACLDEKSPVHQIDDRVLALTEWAMQDPLDSVSVSVAEAPAYATTRGAREPVADVDEEIGLPESSDVSQPLGKRIPLAGLRTLVQLEPDYPLLAHAQDGLRTSLVWGVLSIMAGTIGLLLRGAYWQLAGVLWLTCGLVVAGSCVYQLRKNALSDKAISAGVLNKKMVTKQVGTYRLVFRILMVVGAVLFVSGLALGWISEPMSATQGAGLALFSQGLMALVLSALDWWYGRGELTPRG